MFEKIGRLAEAAATNASVSRRGFFGQLGRGALAAAGVLGGLLAFPKVALASGAYLCCKYSCGQQRGKYGSFSYDLCTSAPLGCPSPYFGCKLDGHKLVSSCLFANVCGP
jgi:hypothetical protein